MIEGAIFDLGGTLIRFEGDWDTTFGISRARLIDFLRPHVEPFAESEFDESFRMAVEAAQRQREKDYREQPLAAILADTLAEFNLGALDDATMRRAMKVMFGASEDAWHPIPGARGVLDETRNLGVKMALVSNASDASNVGRLLDKAEMAGFFEPIVVSAAQGWRKPAEPVFQEVLRPWGLPAESVVMVGDTLGADVLGAQRIGMHQIWIRTAEDRADNQHWMGQIDPEVIVDDLSKVPQVIARWQASGQ